MSLAFIQLLNGSVDIHSGHLNIFFVHFTRRWPPIGAETCSKLVHNKIEHRNIVAYGGFKKSIIKYFGQNDK
jgi:hypothetical protein